MFKNSKASALLVILILGVIAILGLVYLARLVSTIPSIENKEALTVFAAQISIVSGITSGAIGYLGGILASTEKTPVGHPEVPPDPVGE